MLDRWDYIKEAGPQLRNSNVYEEIDYNQKILSQLVGSSNKCFQKLNSSGYVSYNSSVLWSYLAQ